MKQYFEYTSVETDYLKSKDGKMARLIEAAGHIYREVNPDLYNDLVDSIIGQQISTAAHNTIRKRIADRFGLDTSARVNIMSTYYATQAAVRTTQAIMKAVKK